jgi:hypothetical protein
MAARYTLLAPHPTPSRCSSKVPTDITGDTIRQIALPMRFVDVKVCALTEAWSGLKLVVRREFR